MVLIRGQRKQGSGIIIGGSTCSVVSVNCAPGDGFVVTNYHVLSGESGVTISLADGRKVVADEVIAYDADADLAIIRDFRFGIRHHASIQQVAYLRSFGIGFPRREPLASPRDAGFA